MNDAKYAAELKSWRDELNNYAFWYQGQPMDGVPAPSQRERITRHQEADGGTEQSLKLDALDTWIIADKWRYCHHLFVEPTYFNGKRILEIGPGPLGLARFFAGALIHAVEPLYHHYLDLGYPDLTDPRVMDVWNCPAELPDLAERFPPVDAVIAVNSIDCVDDFEATVAFIERVLKPDGEVRIETHYHAGTTAAPHVLSDAQVQAAFKRFDLHKLSDRPSSYFYPAGEHPPEDRFVLWSNRRYLWPAREVLR